MKTRTYDFRLRTVKCVCVRERDVLRMQQVRQHRNLGLSVPEIRTLLDHPGGGAASILEFLHIAPDAITTIRKSSAEASRR